MKHDARPWRVAPIARRSVLRLSTAAILALGCGAACADGVSGSIAYQAKSGPIVVTPKYAYLVSGPDEVSGKPIRRVVLAVADVAPKIQACAAMSCSDGGLREGMTIDFDAGPRLNYWLVANDQRVQYSGTAEPASLPLTVNTPQRLAGKWDLDGRAAGGPRIQIEFDAALLKEMKQAH
jgi:hypothetical protein